MEHQEAGLPRNLLDKFNSAGVHVVSKVIDQEKQYLLTRQEYVFDDTEKRIKKGKKLGIGIAFPLHVTTSEVGRVLTYAIPKIQEPMFDGEELYRMFTYTD